MNKKKIFGSIAVLAIATVAAFNINVSTQENGLSEVALDNVEALASEIGDACGGCSSICRGSYCCTVILNGTGFALNRC